MPPEINVKSALLPSIALSTPGPATYITFGSIPCWRNSPRSCAMYSGANRRGCAGSASVVGTSGGGGDSETPRNQIIPVIAHPSGQHTYGFHLRIDFPPF